MENDPIRKCWIDIKNKDPDSEIKIEINDKLICYLIYT